MECDTQEMEAENLGAIEKLKRSQILGFEPQKEIFCNKHLPYADQLDAESQKMLVEIKSHLGRCLAVRDSIGILTISHRLQNYIRLYGMKFSKEDHVHFINIYLDLLVIPDLGFSQANKFCSILANLLKKTDKLSPQDIVIDWRKLNEIAKIIIYKSDTKGLFYRHTCPLDTNLTCVIQQCALYFPKSATQEILNEFYPKLETREGGKYSVSFEMLSIFLNPIEGYEMWLDDFLTLWLNYHNASFSCDILHIIAKTAYRNIGYIDWEPHIPTMFARIMRSIDLPVTYKGIISAKRPNLWANSIAMWIISTLGPKSSTQKYLSKLMGVIESYLHPANSGKWVSSISEILVDLNKALVDRLQIERYKPLTWKRPVPDEHKLTEECLTAFVECMKPVALQAMYSRMNANDVAKIFKTLADLRPHLIIEDVICRVTTTLESVTEPHKMTAALQCLISVSRAMVSGHRGYTLGKVEAIPILFSTLPGIDPNDFKKTAVTLQFLTSFSCFVPIIDCSKAGIVRDDLTEEEHTICCHTADLENFVLLFMDKVFQLIDSSSVESIRMEQSQSDQVRSKLESITEAWVTSSVHAILAQCSDEILKSAAEKLIKFVQTNLFEPKVAGMIVSALLRVFARVTSKHIMPVLVPYVTEKITDYLTDHTNLDRLERQGDDFLYYLTLLVGMVRGDPREIISDDYRDAIIPIIDRALVFKCKWTHKLLNNILIYWLSNVSAIQTLDVRSLPESYTKPLEEYLPIRHWGEKMKPNDKIDWYVAGEKARKFCEWIIYRYLVPALERLGQFIDGLLVLEKEDLHYTLRLIHSLTKCSNFLPNWDDEPIQLMDSPMMHYLPEITRGFDGIAITMPDGANIRLTIVRLISRLQAKLLVTHEDDIESFKAIIAIWDRIHIQRHNFNTHENQLKSYNTTKVFQDYHLTRRKRELRTVIATRILIQHDLREECNRPRFTATHRDIMVNLVTLATSRYSEVRIQAQLKLFSMLCLYPYSYKCITDILVENLKVDPNEEHDRFKGTLYVIVGQRRIKPILKNDWETLKKLWLGLLNTKLSEKPSIVALMDYITDLINQELTTITIDIKIPDLLAERGLMLINDCAPPTKEDIIAGEQHLAQKGAERLTIYTELLNSIVDTASREGTHWRHHYIASSMIYNLDHPQTVCNQKMTKYFLENLIHDLIDERKIAIQMIIFVMKHVKREHPKIVVDPFVVAGCERPPTVNCGKLPIGIRPDNKFLQYDIEKAPRNQSQWDEPRYSFRSNGFFGWPSEYHVYAPSAQQPNLDQTVDEMNDVHRVIYNFFMDKTNVERLTHFWSLEEKKGKDKFNRWRYVMIKCLFNEFGDAFLDNFLSFVGPLIEDKKNTEGSHRCAAEILTGILRGAKHWDYRRTEIMYEKVIPLVRIILKNITVESEMNWGTCFATAAEHMDPNRQHWLHEAMMENFFSDELTSYISCSRIYCFQGVFAQHIWRMNSAGHRVLNSVRPFFSHAFQNVRERLGSLLINIYDGDFQFPGANEPECPRIRDLMADVGPKLQILHNEPPKSKHNVESMEVESEETLNYNEAIRIFKTVAQFMIGFLNRSMNANRVEFLQLLPIACRLERSETDAELVEVATSLLAMMCVALTYPDTMEFALEKINEVSLMTSWTAKLSVLEFLQAMIFHNMSVVISRDEWVAKVKTIVLRLLEDPSLEVREKSAQVLGGLIHCSFLPATDELLEQFKKKCRTKLIKNGRGGGIKLPQGNTVSMAEGSCAAETREAHSIRERHIGVLGLCAFISAYPYDIPEIVPKAFEQLGAHLNDPQPIPATIRKTVGNFKRTHQDNWATLQLKLTENQLAVLTDVDVPPSYYA